MYKADQHAILDKAHAEDEGTVLMLILVLSQPLSVCCDCRRVGREQGRQRRFDAVSYRAHRHDDFDGFGCLFIPCLLFITPTSILLKEEKHRNARFS